MKKSKRLEAKSQPREFFLDNIGKRVRKDTNKPFKSKSKWNTVTGVIHVRVPIKPNTGFKVTPIGNPAYVLVPAYIFKEDESHVECWRCVPE